MLAILGGLEQETLEIVERFVQKARKHMKEEVVYSEEDYYGGGKGKPWVHQEISLSQVVADLALGLEVSSSAYLQLASAPSVQQVLQAEPGFAASAAGRQVKVEGGGGKGGDAVGGGAVGLESQAAGAAGGYPELQKLREEAGDVPDGHGTELYGLLRALEEKEKVKWSSGGDDGGAHGGKKGTKGVPGTGGKKGGKNVGDLPGKGPTASGDGGKAFGGVAEAAMSLGVDEEEEGEEGEKEEDGDPSAEADQPPSSAGVLREAQHGGGGGEPYETELGYLQHQFELSTVLIRQTSLEREADNLALSLAGEAGDDEGGGSCYTADPYMFMYGKYGGKLGGGRDQDSRRRKVEASLQRVRSKLATLRARVAERLAATRKAGPFWPRLERMTEVLRLVEFEKHLLISIIRKSIDAGDPDNNLYGMKGGLAPGVAGARIVGELLTAYCGSLAEQIAHRRYFYKSATLIREGVVSLRGNDFGGDLTRCAVEMDRRMLDFLVGLDSEFSEIMDGSHLYRPEVALESCVLPESTKKLVVDSVQNFEKFQRYKRRLEVDKLFGYGTGLVLLFYGPSGTGKTMLANGLASMLGKKVLVINFPSLGQNSAGSAAKLIFREAKINDALLFFDECEAVFRTRDRDPSSSVNTLLTELERFDGLCILATNRPNDLDEAMRRRIALSVEFRKPDHILRERIWAALKPPRLRLHKDVNMRALALKYELTGGFIKNAWLGALSLVVARGESGGGEKKGGPAAVASAAAAAVVGTGSSQAAPEEEAAPAAADKEDTTAAPGDGPTCSNGPPAAEEDDQMPEVRMEDLMEASRLQLLGRLSSTDFERRVVPAFGLESLVVPERLMQDLLSIVNHAKARSILVGQWGFGTSLAGHSNRGGVGALFFGPSGTGKSLAAEAVGFDLGQPLKVVNCAELLSKWVGESAKNIAGCFKEAEALDAVLVFDEAEALFGSRDGRGGDEGGGDGGGGGGAARHDVMNVGVLLQQLESFPGVCIVVSNIARQIDPAFMRRFSFTLEFAKPERAQRARLWEGLLPSQAPRAKDVDLSNLAAIFELTGGQIKSAVLRAATRAALREKEAERRISQADLQQAAEEELRKGEEANQHANRGMMMYL